MFESREEAESVLQEACQRLKTYQDAYRELLQENIQMRALVIDAQKALRQTELLLEQSRAELQHCRESRK